MDIITDTGLLRAKPASIRIAQNHNLASSSSHLLGDGASYRRLVGRLIYLTISRPNISYGVHILS